MTITHIVAAMPRAQDPLDLDDVLRRLDESLHVHAFLDLHGAPRRNGERALTTSERAREVGTRLSLRARER